MEVQRDRRQVVLIGMSGSRYAAYELATLTDDRSGEFRYSAATSETEEGLKQT